MTANDRIIMRGNILLAYVALAALLSPREAAALTAQPAFLSPDNGQNYVMSQVMLDGSARNSACTIQYYDGFGRPTVTVSDGVGPSGSPVYALTEYDRRGMESRVWLPAASDGPLGNIDAGTMAGISGATYGDSYAYSERRYDALGRILKTTTPGGEWHDGDRGVTQSYGTNAASSVKRYRLDGSGDPQDADFYPAGALNCVVSTDEDGHYVETYKDLTGNVVLERRNGGNDTYYVTDYAQLRMTVIPPLYQTTSENSLLYKYRYNDWGLCIEKTLPGCEPIIYLYDRYGRLAFMQDARLKGRELYRFYLYDGLGRIAVQGTCGSNRYTDSQRDDGLIPGYRALAVRSIADSGIGGTGYVLSGQDNDAGGDSGELFLNLVESACYYDSYDFPDGSSVSEAAVTLGVAGNCNAGSLPTATMQLTTEGRYLYSVMIYDDRGRLTRTVETLPDDAVMTKDISLSFTGKPVRTETKLVAGGVTHTAVETFRYDAGSDLPVSSTVSLDGSPAATTATYAYDSLGRTSAVNYQNAIRTEYSYDLHGWLTGLDASRTGNGSGLLFSEKVTYADGGRGCYNGNISSVRWVSGDYPVGKDKCSGYDYTYDGNRLLSVTDAVTSNLLYEGAFEFRRSKTASGDSYAYDGCGSLVRDRGKGINRIEYDLLGNPVRVQFSGGDVTEYVYAADGRRLKTIHRKAVDGFAVLETMERELTSAEIMRSSTATVKTTSASGVTSSPLSGLTLPSGTPSQSSSSAAGKSFSGNSNALSSAKVSATHTLEKRELMSADSTCYYGNFLLENGGLKQYTFAGGYITGGGSKAHCHYYIRDHQGNNRVVVDDGGVMEQTTHYYPYGGIMSQSTGQGVQKYKYNAKELDRTHGLDWYDYMARQYDPAIARFTSMDPLCEKYYSISPYAYCHNNPVMFVDSDGMDDHYSEEGVFLYRDQNETNFVIVNDKKLMLNKQAITVEQFSMMASTIYGESSAAYGIQNKEEMYAIASVHLRNSKAYGNKSAAAQRFRDTELKEQDNGMQMANAAMINALSGGTDYSNGANQWDGAEQAMIPEEYKDAASNGRFMYKMNVMGWSISDIDYKSWNEAIDSKFGKGKFNVPQEKTATTDYNKMTNKGKIRLYSTAQYGLTIFWKETR